MKTIRYSHALLCKTFSSVEPNFQFEFEENNEMPSSNIDEETLSTPSTSTSGGNNAEELMMTSRAKVSI